MLRPMGIALMTIVGWRCGPRWREPSWQAVRKQSAAPSALWAAIPMVFTGESVRSPGGEGTMKLFRSAKREDSAGTKPKRRRRRNALLLLAAHVLGFVLSLHALMTVRTAQGTIAWVVSLNTMPIVAVPAYGVFGRSSLEGYVVQRQSRDLLTHPQALALAERLTPLIPDFAHQPGSALAGQRLARLPYLRGNAVELLVDGEATFKSL